MRTARPVPPATAAQCRPSAPPNTCSFPDNLPWNKLVIADVTSPEAAAPGLQVKTEPETGTGTETETETEVETDLCGAVQLTS